MPAVTARVDWISNEAGGRSTPPSVGLRPTVRWQRFVAESQETAWDGEIVRLSSASDRHSLVELRFRDEATLKPEWLVSGEGVELLDGPRVIAVGVVQDSSIWESASAHTTTT